jgi:hypothetical protein
MRGGFAAALSVLSVLFTSTLLAQESRDAVPLSDWPVPFEQIRTKVMETQPLRIAERSLHPSVNAVPSAASHFITTVPCRVVDTRNANGTFGGPKLTGGVPRSFPLPAGPCPGIPANASAYSLNITIFAPEAPGFLSAYPTGSSQPTVSTLNYSTGQTIPNAAIVPGGTSGSIDIFSVANTHVIIDINGYFVEGVVTNLNAGTGMTGGGTGNVTLGIANLGVGTAQIADGAVTDAKVLTITSAGKVANSATTATSSNTPNAIVARDVNGDFSAGTITLAGNLALPVTSASVGVITLGGNRFAHSFGAFNTFLGVNAGNLTMSGTENTASGAYALSNNLIGLFNTAIGAGAMERNTTGNANTASGDSALRFNTSGSQDTASGNQALDSNTFGNDNTATGFEALFNNTTGSSNTANGHQALLSNTTGFGNIAIGDGAGGNLTTGNNNIDIGNVGIGGEATTIRIGTSGTHTAAFIAGIRGVTTGQADAVSVMIDSTGQLGTTSSSRRYKFDIASMGEATEGLMRLRPVTFRYLAHGDNAPLQYGLIAEEVAEVYPELVARNKDGEVETVMYQFLAPMLLNVVQKQQQTIDGLKTTLEQLMRRVEQLEPK